VNPEDLVRRMKAGDEEALDALLARHREPLLGRIRHRLHRGLRAKVDPEDVLSEAHVVVCRKYREFQGATEAEFTAWLARICDFKTREVARHYLDTDRRDLHAERPPGTRTNDSRIPGIGATPSEEAMGAELVERARGAFARLPPHYQEVLILARVAGTDLHQVALQMGRSYEATKKLYARAVALYQQHLREAD